jgi:hypothetical protein
MRLLMVTVALASAVLAVNAPSASANPTCGIHGRTPNIAEDTLRGRLPEPAAASWTTIFIGEVTDVAPKHGDYGTWGAHVTFDVETSFKGEAGPTLTLFDGATGGPGVGFKLGQRYFVVAGTEFGYDTPEPDGSGESGLATFDCSATRPIRDDADAARLRAIGGVPDMTVHVLVTAPQDYAWERRLIVEIGDLSWGAGGSFHHRTTRPVWVTLRHVDDCSVVVRFEALPGHDYQIRLATDGTATVVEDFDGMDAGPGMPPPKRSPCADLPDTAMAPATSGSGSPPWVLLLASLAVGAAVSRRLVRTSSGDTTYVATR